MILRLPAEIVRFVADEARLEQIAINLLSNASKYTAQEGTIEFSGSREGLEIVLRCNDNGHSAGDATEDLRAVYSCRATLGKDQ